MSPAGYKARYERLQVPLADGGTTEVKVNQYRRRGQEGQDVDEAALTTFLNTLHKKHVDMELRVDPGSRSVRILHRNRDSSSSVSTQTTTGPVKVGADFLKHLSAMARYVFVGKGAPEHCQIVLQLVEHWKLANGTLQTYADKALGIDCNGFVGNYLWHANRQQSWASLGVGKHEEGPDVTIDGYFDRRKAIRRWEDLNPAKSYIMGLVDPAGHIIPGGNGKRAGHIVITEPGRSRPGSAAQRPAVWAVECTAAHSPGLWESWYTVLNVSSKGIFTLKREDMIAGHQILDFKIAPA